MFWDVVYAENDVAIPTGRGKSDDFFCVPNGPNTDAGLEA